MTLRLRLVLLFASVACALLVALGTLAAMWQHAQRAREDAEFLDLQRTAWRGLQDAALARLRGQADALAAGGPLVDALQRDDPQAQPTELQAADGNRLDVYDGRGRVLYTTSLSVTEVMPMLDVAGTRRVLAGQAVAGLVPVAGGSFSFVVAVPVRVGDRIVGGITLGAPVEAVLDALSHDMGRPVALYNLRGQAVAGNGRARFAQLAPAVSLQREGVADEAGWRVASLPVTGYDHRLVGGIASLRDVSADERRLHLFMAETCAGALLFAAAAFGALFLRLRWLFAPLGRAVDVLTALSRGDTGVRVDAERTDEAGLIAQGVERLRGEMINLEVLRDERQRERRRQERMIRDELRALAGTLDATGRDEVLAELESALADRRADDGGRQLALLATVLRGLSARVQGQQHRLLELLEELNDALREQEALAALRQELEIARRMQMSILPRGFARRAEVDVASLILPAREVGGDFYDWFMLDEHRLGVVIADVSGKGVPAAFFMAIARTLLKVSARFLASPAQTLARANQLLAADNDEMMFVTLFYGVLDLRSGRLAYASGGHNPPALRRAGGGVALLPAPGGMALGVEPQARFGDGELALAPGDVLFLYTDGVTEARDPRDALFGEDALLGALAALPPDAPAEAYPPHVAAAVDAFAQDAPQADDITCVALRFNGPPSAAAPR
jgi:sigma-B regulation protein RsbU (phosphoserine phosphatase)